MELRNRRLSLRGLRAFCIAAEQDSFREAAEMLFITPSAVSHQIKSLEQEIGTQLFERRPRSISLSQAGELLYEDIRPLIEQLDAVASRHRLAQSRSILRISVQPFFASEQFIPGLDEFTKQHPEIDIKVDTSDESGEKHASTVDVSIRIFSKMPDSLAAYRLFALKLLPAASPELCRKIRPGSSNKVETFTRLVHESRPNAWKDWATSSGIRLPEESRLMRLDSMIAVARAAERGLGVALVPAQLSDAWFESGALAPLFSHELVTKDAFYFVCRTEDESRDEVRRLRDWVLQKFGDKA
jgi:LysR family glycine cleavage system transcriptional activator